MFLPNFIKIDPYNFELYRFKLGVFFLRHSVHNTTLNFLERHSENECITSAGRLHMTQSHLQFKIFCK